ncbi:uncharacterized protein LOC125347934 isoform X2 [Perognathus longimembris pacificus]|uniref:uncharacterized protein LOC125347934 isoform X2 n=1 Tax=Perognathus longimembris pacificus TaxID=214514 RepID=UPI0020185789|nr:uncharacterized protein LOC125347934 isoform X2 [Perognathus longimembris pacificus]
MKKRDLARVGGPYPPLPRWTSSSRVRASRAQLRRKGEVYVDQKASPMGSRVARGTRPRLGLPAPALPSLRPPRRCRSRASIYVQARCSPGAVAVGHGREGPSIPAAVVVTFLWEPKDEARIIWIPVMSCPHCLM